eukprot:m.36416 g.36416  ORF g.36416 m.36416 type:complete len:121 (+) comp32248_c0_seq10:484-846(+)
MDFVQTFFSLTEKQKKWLENRKKLIAKHEEWRSLKEDHLGNYHAVHTPIPPRHPDDAPAGIQPDACRISGSMEIKKIAGNFHITAGKSVPHPRGHAHMSAFIPRECIKQDAFNFLFSSVF